MLGRADAPVLVAGILLAAVVTAGAIVGVYNLVPTWLYSAGTVLIYGYSAFWAFSIRRALSVRLYRSQALGIALICMSVLSAFLLLDVLGLWILFIVVIYFAFFIVFYWVDSSVRAARLTDPLWRDTFSWRRLRFPLWGRLLAMQSLSSLSVLILR